MGDDAVKLKPCPFCGGEAVPQSCESDQPGEVDWVVVCGTCGHGAPHVAKRHAIAAWNRRVGGGDGVA